MSAVDQHVEAHRLKTELGWGARRIGRELGISRYAAEQLLDKPLPQPVAEVADEVAEPLADQSAGVAEPVAERPAEVAEAGALRPLPRRVSAERLEIDLRQWRGLRRDLALLADGGFDDPVDAIAQAVKVLAAGYRQGIAQCRIVPGPFVVRDVTVGPPMPEELVPRRSQPAPPGGG